MSVVLVLELELELELDEVDAVPDGDDDVEGREDLMANLSLDFPLPPNRRCLLLRFVVVAVPCFFELTLPMVFSFGTILFLVSFCLLLGFLFFLSMDKISPVCFVVAQKRCVVGLFLERRRGSTRVELGCRDLSLVQKLLVEEK